MTVAYVQAVANSANAAYINISPTAGNTLAIEISTSAGGGTPTVTAVQAMSGTNGGGSVLGTFTIPTALQTTSYSGGTLWHTGAYLLSVPSGTQSILATFNGGTPGSCLMIVAEASGSPSSFLTGVRQLQAAPGTTANAITSTTASVSSIPAYLLGIVQNSGDSDTVAGTSFTGRFASTNDWFIEDRRETSATGSYAATATAATHGGTDTYVATLFAFAETSSVTGDVGATESGSDTFAATGTMGNNGVRLTLRDTDTGALATSLTGLIVSVRSASNSTGALIAGSTSETTDGSGVFDITTGGNIGDYVYVTIEKSDDSIVATYRVQVIDLNA